MPGEEGQEVLRFARRRVGEKAGKVSEKTHDFIGIFMFFAKLREVKAAVALTESLAGFIDQERVMDVGDPLCLLPKGGGAGADSLPFKGKFRGVFG